VFRIVSKVHLEGRGNSEWRNVWILSHISGRTDQKLCLWSCTSCHLASCLLFLTSDAKNLEVCTLKEEERACIRGLLSNWQTSLVFFVMYFFLSCKVHPLWSKFCH
jgi:hypothetical protein